MWGIYQKKGGLMVALLSCPRLVTNPGWAEKENIWAEAARTGGKKWKTHTCRHTAGTPMCLQQSVGRLARDTWESHCHFHLVLSTPVVFRIPISYFFDQRIGESTGFSKSFYFGNMGWSGTKSDILLKTLLSVSKEAIRRQRLDWLKCFAPRGRTGVWQISLFQSNNRDKTMAMANGKP